MMNADELVNFLFLMKKNFMCLNIMIFKTQLGPVARNATLGHPAGYQTCDLTNLV